jgi:penicillin-binding protein 2B
MKSNTHNKRITIISGGLILVVVVVISRLFFVQVLHGNAYDEKADSQFISSSTDMFNRGKIYFTKKDGQRIEAATVMEGYKLAIHPNQMIDTKKAAENIGQVITIDKNDFLLKTSKKNDTYEEIADHLSREEALKIQSYKDTGVEVTKEKWRFYPGDSLASHTIGFVSYKGDVLAGRYGIERYYDDVLSRTEENLNVNFFAEVFSNISDTLFTNDHNEGDIEITIEPEVQLHIEKELDGIMKKWGSDSGGRDDDGVEHV